MPRCWEYFQARNLEEKVGSVDKTLRFSLSRIASKGQTSTLEQRSVAAAFHVDGTADITDEFIVMWLQ